MLKITPLKQLQIVLISLLFTFTIDAQVGIGNDDPSTTLDVNGSVSLRSGGNLNLVNGNNNITLPLTSGNVYSNYRITGPTSPFNLRTINPIASADGQLVTIINSTSQSMTLAHDTGGGGDNRRIFCPGSRDLTLSGQYATVTLQYSAADTRWIVINHSDNRYGDNIQSVVGTSDTSINTNIFTDMADMSITFTPKHSTIYLSFSAAGFADIASGFQMYADFRLVNVTAGNTVIAGTNTLTTDFDFDDVFGILTLTSWNAQLVMFPVNVTPGVSTTLKIQWRRDGNFPAAVFNNALGSPDDSHRNLTIFD